MKSMVEDSTCILIPIYKINLTEFEEFSLKRILQVFSEREIIIICPDIIVKDLVVISSLRDCKIESFNDNYFLNIRTYNRLLMNIDFYRRFEDFNYVLICQLDVLVIKDDLDYWIKKRVDNIGAPIFEGYTKAKPEIKNGNNGGFCLRNVQSCIRVLSALKLSYSSIRILWLMESVWYRKLFRLLRDGIIFNYHWKPLKPVINEDMYWSVIVPVRFKWFVSATPEMAMKFAFDANPALIFSMTQSYPMAIHAWWKYDREFVKSVMNVHNIDYSELVNL